MSLSLRNRQFAGNICLVVFLALMFTLLPGQLWNDNAYAAENPVVNTIGTNSAIADATATYEITGVTDAIFASSWASLLANLAGSYVHDAIYQVTYRANGIINAMVYLVYDNASDKVLNTYDFVYQKDTNGLPTATSVMTVWRPPTRSHRDRTTTFTDAYKDIADHWANKEINKLASLRVISGYPDGKFYPEKKVTRAEFAALVVRALKLTDPAKKLFDDVNLTEWYADEIANAYTAGIIKGYGKTFKPNQVISREEMAAMVARALTYKKNLTAVGTTEGNELISKFSDKLKVADWAKQDLATLLKEKVLLGRDNNTLDPAGLTTRAESAVLVYRILERLGQL